MTWHELISLESQKPYWLALQKDLLEESSRHKIYPSKNDIFAALKLTPFSDVKVVILGQDPYHGDGQAHGLSFSVREGVAPPPSLQNIFKELESDLGTPRRAKGDLTSWAKQGVFAPEFCIDS